MGFPAFNTFFPLTLGLSRKQHWRGFNTGTEVDLPVGFPHPPLLVHTSFSKVTLLSTCLGKASQATLARFPWSQVISPSSSKNPEGKNYTLETQGDVTVAHWVIGLRRLEPSIQRNFPKSNRGQGHRLEMPLVSSCGGDAHASASSLMFTKCSLVTRAAHICSCPAPLSPCTTWGTFKGAHMCSWPAPSLSWCSAALGTLSGNSKGVVLLLLHSPFFISSRLSELFSPPPTVICQLLNSQTEKDRHCFFKSLTLQTIQTK